AAAARGPPGALHSAPARSPRAAPQPTGSSPEEGTRMNALTITLGTVASLISLVCWVMFASGVWRMVKTIALGQPDRTRNTPVVPRVKTVIVEFLAHTKMLKNRTVGAAHWFVMIGFLGG